MMEIKIKRTRESKTDIKKDKANQDVGNKAAQSYQLHIDHFKTTVSERRGQGPTARSTERASASHKTYGVG